MIAAWMFSAVVFTALLGATAFCADAALRAARRPTRAPWLLALAVGVTWPVIAPVSRYFLPAGNAQAVVMPLPSIQAVSAEVPSTLAWTAGLDTLLLVLWSIASVVLIVRLMHAYVDLARVRRASEPRVIDGVSVLVSADVGPAVVGVVAPSVLLPAALLDLAAPLRRLVLRHEEEHCRARDPWVVIGSAVALALVPWNLPLWWIVRRARLALEVDCDARVLATEGSAPQYGKLLLLISQRQSVTPFAPMLAASRSHLERRIAAMRPIATKGRRTRIAVALAATIVTGVAACNSRIADVSAPRPMIVPEGPTVAIQPYFEFQVEKRAQQIPGTGSVRYPDAQRSANVQGLVLAQFVVDANGVIEPGTFKVLKSNHGAFTDAVAAALPNMRFSPAEIGGLRVRQLVQQPFKFSVSGPPSPNIPAESKADIAPAVPKPADERSDRPAGEIMVGHLIPSSKKDISTALLQSGYRRDSALSPNDIKGLAKLVPTEARQLPGTGMIRYPDELRRARVEGEVIAQLVVDVNGEVMPGSFKVIRSSHPLFSEAVQASISSMRFEPAQVGGKKVRQLLQRPFTFSLSK